MGNEATVKLCILEQYTELYSLLCYSLWKTLCMMHTELALTTSVQNIFCSDGNLVGYVIVLSYGLNDWGFQSWQRLGIFLFTTAVSRVALGPTQLPVQWVPGALALYVKQPGREADHSPPASSKVKECVELCLHSTNTPSWRGSNLKHRDNLPIYQKLYFHI